MWLQKIIKQILKLKYKRSRHIKTLFEKTDLEDRLTSGLIMQLQYSRLRNKHENRQTDKRNTNNSVILPYICDQLIFNKNHNSMRKKNSK